MVYSYYEDITLADVKEILLSSVQPLDTLEGVTRLSTAVSWGQTYLTVQVTDADGCLSIPAYAVGALTAEQF